MRSFRALRLASGPACAAALLLPAPAEEPAPPPTRHEGETPRAAAIAPSLRAGEGLEVRLWAASPLLHNPISIDLDERGRVWVAEGVNYRGFNNREKGGLWREGGDRILILEDRDGDGRAETSTVFVENDPDLTAPCGVSVIGDKVVVACSPHLLVYTRDAADRVAGREILLTGFGGFDHDHSLHQVQAGPDGRWYFNVGNAGPHLVTDRSGWNLRSGSSYTGGSPHNKENTPELTSDDGRVHVAGLMLSVEPGGTGLQVLGMGARNPFGTCVDSFGEVWSNDNDDTFSCRTTWWMRYGNCGFSSTDGRRSWAADRRPGQDVRSAHWRQDDPGVIPSGHVYGNGAPTGIVYYEGGALGPDFEDGLLLSCEAGQNVVWAYRREPRGAGFDLAAFPLLSSTGIQDPHYIWKDEPSDLRQWFRPSDVAVGTDGAVYVSDWFDAVVGGHKMVDLQGEGAIYRVFARGADPRPPRYPEGAAGTLDRLLSPAVHPRAAGLAELRAAADPGPALALYRDSGRPRCHRARALWAAGLIRPEAAREALADADPEFRVLALRILERSGGAGFSEAAGALLSDPSPAVRRELCLAVRDAALADRLPAIRAAAAAYLESPSEDRWLLEAIGTAADGDADEVYADLLKRGGGPPSAWTARFAELAWRLHPATSIAAFRERALDPGLPEAARRRSLDALAFLPERAAAEAVFAAATEGPGDLRPYAAYWVRHRETHHWAGFGLAERLPGTGETTAQVAGRLEAEFLKAGTAPERRRALAMEMARIPAAAIRLTRLLDRPDFPEHLEEEILPLLLAQPDSEVRNALAWVRPQAVAALRGQTGAAYSVAEVVRWKGDPARGRELFFGTGACSACHAHSGKGGEAGPDLTAVGRKFDQAGLIDSIINPSSAILVGYEATRVDLGDGSSLLGFVEAEGDPMVVRDAAGQRHVVPASRIASRSALETSLMPPMSSLLSASQVADIAAFLRSP